VPSDPSSRYRAEIASPVAEAATAAHPADRRYPLAPIPAPRMTRPPRQPFLETLGPRGLRPLDSARQTGTGNLARVGDVLDLAGAART
jgi:hypothetical protein